MLGLGINDDRGDKQKKKDSERNVSGARLFFNVKLQEVRTATIESASRAVIDEARKKTFIPWRLLRSVVEVEGHGGILLKSWRCD